MKDIQEVGFDGSTYSDPLEDLVNHDFTKGEDFDFEQSSEMIEIMEREIEVAKSREADEVIEELAHKYVESEYFAKLNKCIENFKAFLAKYNVEKEEVKNMTEKQKDNAFAAGKFLSKNLANVINDLTLSIEWKRDEYKFLSTALTQKLSYDGNEVFNIIELNEKYLKEWKETDKALPKQIESFMVDIDIRNVVMLYHFLGKHSVKGIGAEFYTFANILGKIADTNKIYNAYNIIKSRLDNDFTLWTSAITELGNIDNVGNVDKIEGDKENE